MSRSRCVRSREFLGWKGRVQRFTDQNFRPPGFGAHGKRPHCAPHGRTALRSARSAPALLAVRAALRSVAKARTARTGRQGFSRALGPCLRLARGCALRLWLCPSETRSSPPGCWASWSHVLTWRPHSGWSTQLRRSSPRPTSPISRCVSSTRPVSLVCDDPPCLLGLRRC